MADLIPHTVERVRRKLRISSPILIGLVLAIAILALAEAAAAAPPERGARAPWPGNATSIERDFVGLAVSGPRDHCEEPDDEMCIWVEYIPISCRLWRRSSGTWIPAGVIRNDDPRLFFVTPYGGGYHWVLSPTFGVRALSTGCLAHWAPDRDVRLSPLVRRERARDASDNVFAHAYFGK